MTTHEFVSHEAIKYKTVSPLVKQGFSNGLTKGLEIAVKALAFARQNAINGEDGCWDYNPHDQILHSLTDAELLTIFLTEKYENNG
jgi:hypothetical protein